MYAPAPPRPKKTGIVRSRSGCKCCRERRTKCDEKNPTCGTCDRLGTACEPVKPKFEFRIMTGPTSISASPSTRCQRPNMSPKTNQKLLSPESSSEIQIYSQHTPDIPFIPDLRLIQSLQRSGRDAFYSAYWEDHCLPALHPMFLSASHIFSHFPALKNAVLALSSCNVSRMNAERKYSAATSYMGAFTPNLTHQTRSQMYYSSAIHTFTKLSKRERRYNASLVLTMLVLFAYIESTMGNFEGFYCHVQGLTAFLDEEISKATGSPFVKSLLTAWMQPQFLVWWARIYFSSLDVQQQQPGIVIPRILQASFETLHERRIVVLSILANESVYEESHVAHEHDIGQYSRLLARETLKLDEWLLHLPPSELPVESDAFNDNSEFNTLKPLTFESHNAALNYAYYVLSRIMQCTGFLHLLRTRDPQYLGHECYEEEPWVRLLLRITKGIDIKACICQNAYTIGFSALILAALLRCQDLLSGIWIETWLQALEDMQPTEEGSFPVYQALAVARAINQQRVIGRDVFGVSQPVDDGGGAPKFSSYNSQMINTLLIHGKFRASGDLFTDCITIGI